MKAAVHTRYGPPEVVHLAEVDAPVVGPGELLVKVHATTVNRTDCGFRAASPFVTRLFTGLVRPRVTIMGNEFAGEVVALGPGVGSFVVGDRVFGYNEGPFGAHAELMAIAADASVATIPPNVTFDKAAASTEGSHYALAFIAKAGIGPGSDVLVNGATGAIGSAAVQLLAHMGAHVTAVCGTDHVELVAGLGAEKVIDYRTEDFTAGPDTYDAVLDTVGKSTFARCKPVLKPDGTYLSSELGPGAQNPLLALVTRWPNGKKVRFPFPSHDQEMIRHIRDLLESGAFDPVIDRRMPLDDIVEAYRYVESGRKVGNVVIVVDDEVATR